jgi:hypothetical protein
MEDYVLDPPARLVVTHFVPMEEPENRWRRARALCGQHVHVIREVSGSPSCADCAERLVAYEESMDACEP